MILSDDLIKYILFQRTTHIKFADAQIIKLLSKYTPCPFYKIAVTLEASLRKKEIKELYQKDIFDDYLEIKPFLPNKCQSILDVGCGIAGIDLFFFRHYDKSDFLKFHLLDKTEMDKKVFYNYKPKGAFYNSLFVACEFLRRNGIPEKNINLLEAEKDFQIKAPPELDLIVSLISWGFHYPVSTYLDQVYNLLRKDGHLIMDLRKERGGEKELEQKFSSVTKISERQNSCRVLAVK